MFYFIASKIWSANKPGYLRNIIITGTICYIILHAYLFGKNRSESVSKFKNYIYYLFLIDSILVGSYIYLFNRGSIEESDLDQDTNNDDLDTRDLPLRLSDVQEIDELDESESTKEKLNTKSDRGTPKSSARTSSRKDNKNNLNDIKEKHRHLLELKAKHELRLKDDISPFAKKDNNVSPVKPNEKQQDDNNQLDPVDKDKDKDKDKSISGDSIPMYLQEPDTDIPLYNN